MEIEKENKAAESAWQLFQATGRISYYNLYKNLTKKQKDK